MKSILKITVLLCIIIIITKHLRSPTELYNSVELHAKYKNYIVIDKYTKNHKYYLILQNPYFITKQTTKIEVKDYIYYNIYFVKDTIK